MEWKPIARERIAGENVDRHAEASELLEVRIRLSDEPPPDWVQAFERGFNTTTYLSMHPFRIEGDEVVITPPDNELEAYVASVDQRIAAANNWYETQVWPRIVQRQQVEQAREDAEAKRLADVRRRARDL